MASATMALPARPQAAPALPARRRPRLVQPTQVVHFDGRDVSERAAPKLPVQRRAVAPCRHCGTLRDVRFAFCCEVAALWADDPSAPSTAGTMRRAPRQARPAGAVSTV